MDTYGVAEAVDASVPDMFDQFFRADDTILVKHKIFQQCGFLPGERKFFVVDAGFSCTGIKGDTSAFQADIFLNKFSPCQAADPGFQFLEVKRLCQIVICSKIKSFYFVLDLSSGGKDQNRCEGVYFPELPQDFRPSMPGRFRSRRIRS